LGMCLELQYESINPVVIVDFSYPFRDSNAPGFQLEVVHPNTKIGCCLLLSNWVFG
jgi:hypothetical protein